MLEKARPVTMNEQDKTSVIMRLPSTLSVFSGGKSQLLLNAETFEQLLDALESQYPLVWEQLCDAQGRVRKKIQIYVSNRLVTTPADLNMALKPGQEVIVLPSNVEA
jgi:molybdopterin synthase sulfur carrier subunit